MILTKFCEVYIIFFGFFFPDGPELFVKRHFCFLKVAEIGHLDEEIMALHSEIVELQRSPYARRQGDVMEQLYRSVITFYTLYVACLSSS